MEIESAIKQAIVKAVKRRCDCVFDTSAIQSGEFSFQTFSTDVIYRAILNATGLEYPATEFLKHVENWIESEGTLLYEKFRLRLVKTCPLHIHSFNEVGCGNEDEQGNGGAVLFGPHTCYKLQACNCSSDQG